MSDKEQPDVRQLKEKFDIQGLIQALRSDDKAIRKRAAAALRTLDATHAIKALREAYKQEDDPQTRMVIASAIQALLEYAKRGQKEAAPVHSDVPAVQQLIQRLHSADSEAIIEAARKLGDLGDKIAVEPLVMLFQDPSMSIRVRFTVAEALLKLESAPVEVTLLANLRDEDWHIRRNGAAILGQLKAEWAIEALANALRDPHPVVQRTARAALKRIGTPESRKVLAQASGVTSRAPLRPAGGSNRTPRRGMLQHLDSGEDDTSEGEGKKDVHFNPTRPLDPDVLKKLEQDPPSDQGEAESDEE